MIRNQKRTLLIAISVILAVGAPFFLLFNHIYIGYTEYYVLNPDKALNILQTWQSEMLGQTSTGNLWRIPFDSYYLVGNYFLKIPPNITQAFFLAMIDVLGFIFYLLFINEIFPSSSKISQVLGSLFFVFNIYVLFNLSSTYAFLLPYFALPLQLLLFKKAIDPSHPAKYVVGIGLVSAAVWGVNLTFACMSTALLIAFGIWEVFVVREGRGRRLAIVLLASTGLTVMLSSWWLVPMLYEHLSYKSNTTYILNSEGFNGLDSTVSNVFQNLGDWSFFSGFKGVPYHNYSTAYKQNPIVLLTMYLIPVLFASSLLLIPRRKDKYDKRFIFFILVTLVCLPIIGGTNGAWPTSGLLTWVFTHVPFARAFRNTYKFTEISTFGYAVAISYVLNGAKKYYGISNLKTYFGIALFLGILISNTFPLWTGKVFENRSTFSKFPQYWSQMAEYVNANLNPSTDRILLTPDQYFPVFVWNGSLRAFGSEFTDITLSPSVVHDTCKGCVPSQNADLMHFIYKNLGTTNTDKFLANIGINSILQRNDFAYKYYGSQSPSQIKNEIKKYRSITLQKSVGRTDLYQIKPGLNPGLIYSPNRLIGVSDLKNNLASYSYFPADQKSAFIIENQPNTEIVRNVNQYFLLFNDDKATVQSGVIQQAINVNYPGRFQFASSSIASSITPYLSTAAKSSKIGRTSFIEKGRKVVSARISISPINLLRNGSFSNGPWQSKAGDCRDQNPGAALGLRLVEDRKMGKVIELSAESDIACVHSPTTSGLDNSSDYVLSLSYKILAGEEASYCVWDGFTCLSSRSLRSAQKGQWNAAEIPVKPNSNSKNVSVFLYAPAEGASKSVVQFADVSLNAINGNVLNQYALLPSRINTINTSNPKVTRRTSTKVSLEIHKTKNPSAIVFQETYDPSWRAYIVKDPTGNPYLDSSFPIKQTDHFMGNGYANVWLITPESIPSKFNNDGHYYLELYYSPQYWFYLGSIISGLTLLGCIGYLIWIPLSRRRRREGE